MVEVSIRCHSSLGTELLAFKWQQNDGDWVSKTLSRYVSPCERETLWRGWERWMAEARCAYELVGHEDAIECVIDKVQRIDFISCSSSQLQ